MKAAVGDVGRTDETGMGKRSTRRDRENQGENTEHPACRCDLDSVRVSPYRPADYDMPHEQAG